MIVHLSYELPSTGMDNKQINIKNARGEQND
jgi:hypothetical protein